MSSMYTYGQETPSSSASPSKEGNTKPSPFNRNNRRRESHPEENESGTGDEAKLQYYLVLKRCPNCHHNGGSQETVPCK